MDIVGTHQNPSRRYPCRYGWRVHPAGRVTDRYYLCSPAPIEIPRYNPGQAIFLSLIILVPLLYLMYDSGPLIIF